MPFLEMKFKNGPIFSDVKSLDRFNAAPRELETCRYRLGERDGHLNAVRETVLDIHSHFYPRWYLDLLHDRSSIPRVSRSDGVEEFVIFPEEENPEHGGRVITEDYWSLESKLSYMERFGIDQTLLSLGNPWLDFLDESQGVEIARHLNEDFSTLGSRTKGRIFGMGALPGAGVENVSVVIREIAAQENLFGAITGTRIAGYAFDAPELDPVWLALQESGLPLLVHPHYGLALDQLEGFGHAMPVAVGFPLETTVCLARLVYAGVLHRFPGVRLVGSHGGGALPFLAGRLDAGWSSDPGLVSRMPTPPSDVLDQLFLDAVLYHPRALRTAADLVGAGHLMFGTDHPFSIADPAANLSAIKEAFSDEEALLVLASSAMDLYEMPAKDGET